MPTIGTTEILLILLVVLLLFGAKKLPELSRSIGRSAHILKSETRALREDDDVPGQAAPPRVHPVDDDPGRRPESVRDVA